MARQISNISLSVYSWQGAIDKINELAYVISSITLTAAANTTGATTSGNAAVSNYFAANTFAGYFIRGGNIASSANLACVSNISFTNGYLIITSNLANTVANTTLMTGLSNGDLVVDGSRAHLSVTNAVISDGQLTISSNVNVNSANVTVQGGQATVTSNVNINAANTTIQGGQATVTSNINVTSANVTVQGTQTTVSSNVNINAANVTVQGGQTTVSSNLNVTSANVNVQGTQVTVSSNVNINAANVTVQGGIVTLGSNVSASRPVTVSNTVTVNGNVTINGLSVAVTGNTTFTNTVTFSDSVTFANNLTISTISPTTIALANVVNFIAFSNTNLGTNVTADRLVSSLAVATYKAGKLLLHLTNLAGNTQIVEGLFTANGTDVAYSASLIFTGTSQLANVSVGLNGANIEIYVLQNQANLSVKGFTEAIRV